MRPKEGTRVQNGPKNGPVRLLKPPGGPGRKMRSKKRQMGQRGIPKDPTWGPRLAEGSRGDPGMGQKRPKVSKSKAQSNIKKDCEASINEHSAMNRRSLCHEDDGRKI